MFKDYFPAHLVTLNTIKVSKREEQRISIMLTRFPQREVLVTAFNFGATGGERTLRQLSPHLPVSMCEALSLTCTNFLPFLPILFFHFQYNQAQGDLIFVFKYLKVCQMEEGLDLFCLVPSGRNRTNSVETPGRVDVFIPYRKHNFYRGI